MKQDTHQSGTSIPSTILQEVLESASNAGEKGLSQFFTPVEFARLCALPLPLVRPVIVDLTCGNGQFLAGASNESTRHVLGIDIDPCGTVAMPKDFTNHHIITSKIVGDVTLVSELAARVKLECDLFVLNFPWSMKWERERMTFLAQTDDDYITKAFMAADPRLRVGEIDSTIAGMLMALAFMSDRGEGVVIANEATLQRLIFKHNAPHRDLARFCWAHLVVAGNPMTGISSSQWSKDEFKTGVLYFAKSHTGGLDDQYTKPPADSMLAFREQVRSLKRYLQREGTEVAHLNACMPTTLEAWRAIREEWNERQGKRKGRFNLWLNPDGTIATQLSTFEEMSIEQKLAESLYSLKDQRPMQLVMQQEGRKALLRAVNGNVWKVSPDLPAKVDEAIKEYHAVRSPLYPLPPVQRLGYLDEDEQSFIVCAKNYDVIAPDMRGDTRHKLMKFLREPNSETWDAIAHTVVRTGEGTFWQAALDADLVFANSHPNSGVGRGRNGKLIPIKPVKEGTKDEWAVVPDPEVLSSIFERKRVFTKDQRYAIDCRTVLVERLKMKVDYSGEDQEVLLNGHELAIYITDANGEKRCFLDGRHFEASIKDADDEPIPVDLTLQDLVEHFHVPEVPDVSQCYPERFATNLQAVDRIQECFRQYVPGFTFRNFQRADLARGTVHDGEIFSWDTGLGKTIGGPCLALIKLGHENLVPDHPVLIVAPGHLHEQMIDDVAPLGIYYHKLDCQETFHHLSAQARNAGLGNNTLKPGFYITSFTQLARNKVLKIPEVTNLTKMDDLAEVMVDFGVTFEAAKALAARGPTLASRKEAVVMFSKPPPGGWLESDKVPKRSAMTLAEAAVDLCQQKLRILSDGVGKEVRGVRCVYSASLAELVRGVFKCVIVDEGVRIKGEDSQIGLGCRMLEPEFRYVLTGTPIKNRLRDIFWLMWWASGGKPEAHARFPYAGTLEEQNRFAGEFSVCERNLTKERANNGGRLLPDYKVKRRKDRGRGTATPEVCNIHLLWKLNGPNVLRRRKDNTGDDMVKKIRNPIWVPMGKEQAQVYHYHLTRPYRDKDGKASTIARLTALRSASGAPNSGLLERGPERLNDKHYFPTFRSMRDYIPKVAATLSVIEQIMQRGEQVVVFSALKEPNHTLSRRLRQAGIPHDLLDGDTTEGKRGKPSLHFKQGPGKGNPVLLAGVKAMGEGHNWPLCRNAILISYDWAYDLFIQAINRIHRMTSMHDVNIWPIMAKGTIDRKLEALIDEKGDACELVLDGRLIGEEISAVNLREILEIAYNEFDPKATYPEEALEQEWPELCDRLKAAYAGWYKSKSVAGQLASARLLQATTLPTLPTLLPTLPPQVTQSWNPFATL